MGAHVVPFALELENRFHAFTIEEPEPVLQNFSEDIALRKPGCSIMNTNENAIELSSTGTLTSVTWPSGANRLDADRLDTSGLDTARSDAACVDAARSDATRSSAVRSNAETIINSSELLLHEPCDSSNRDREPSVETRNPVKRPQESNPENGDTQEPRNPVKITQDPEISNVSHDSNEK